MQSSLFLFPVSVDLTPQLSLALSLLLLSLLVFGTSDEVSANNSVG
jgi:hypothetical protein